MSAKRLDGKACASSVESELADRIESLKSSGVQPHLAVIIVGDDPASHVYVNSKVRMCKRIGIRSTHVELPEDTTEEILREHILAMNSQDDLHGILIQSPLPNHMNEEALTDLIDPSKDVDGFSSENVGKLSLNKSFISPCTPKGVMKMLESIKYDLRGKDCVIIGASNIVGRPMSMELLNAGATVQVCHKGTKNITEKTKVADVIIAAAGVANLVKSDWVKEGAVIIDVGINRLDDGTLAGDVDFDDVKDIASAISPVPGGVGPMTIAVLLENTLIAYQAKL